MPLLPDTDWPPKYAAGDGPLLTRFYVPVLAAAERYDRTTGYFSPAIFVLALRGVEGLVLNRGRMRLVVGCTLGAAEVAAIEQGTALRDTVAAALLAMPLDPGSAAEQQALELLAWMVAKGVLEVRVAVPCDARRRPVAGTALFHEKAGIVEDKAGHRLAFNGSLNETAQGWTGNWESFHVFCDWDGGAGHVEAEELSFARLWRDEDPRALVVDVPAAVRDRLMDFLPAGDEEPARLRRVREQEEGDPPPEAAADPPPPAAPPPAGAPAALSAEERRRLVWAYIHDAARRPEGGARVGEATAAVTPWPHQIRAFHRMYEHWPPRLLIADEVGLGKTIQAGLLLRQAWLAGRAGRILVLAPKAVLKQWQIELREKFNLDWPVYDGQRLLWAATPCRGGPLAEPVARPDWHRQPFVLVSSHLMRRSERARDLLEEAEPWDLVVLDEAHHARRRGGGTGTDDRPNRLLRLMQQLRHRTRGLILLTATPMQVSPIEVWDLLSLLGLPPDWTAPGFLAFFEAAGKPSPSYDELAAMARLFRASEQAYGEVAVEEAVRLAPGNSPLKARKILKALRAAASTPLKLLAAEERRAAVRLMVAHTPVKRLISRHTRQLLRTYFKKGMLSTRIADRQVEDRDIALSPAERSVYEAVEDYIANTYNRAAGTERNAVGFVMTIYRRRLASSFAALARTLESRLDALKTPASFALPNPVEDDVDEDETRDDAMDADEAGALEAEALTAEEGAEIAVLLDAVRRLPTDTKAIRLVQELRALQAAGYRQALVFTQFTDTLDFLRDLLAGAAGFTVMCFSGRGGEIRSPAGAWQAIKREQAKQLFREGAAEILLCTDAAAEGLNFQFCGALVNYDMPWNPMRVEQRIGRIDRLGQQKEVIRIVNLHYADTVETDVYIALRGRIRLFEGLVGKLQPILAKLPKAIGEAALASREDRERRRHALGSTVLADADRLDAEGFDLDAATEDEIAEIQRPDPALTLADLGRLLGHPALLPPSMEVKATGEREVALTLPGRPAFRATTDPEYFDAHPESVELWSPGSASFQGLVGFADGQGIRIDTKKFRQIIWQYTYTNALE